MAGSDSIRIGGEALKKKKIQFPLGVGPREWSAPRTTRVASRFHSAVDDESMLTYGEKTDELASVGQLLIDHHLHRRTRTAICLCTWPPNATRQCLFCAC
jgi:hypothetical protein